MFPKFRQIKPKLLKITDAPTAVSARFSVLKVKWGYISALEAQSERSKSFAVSISLKT